MLFYGNFAVLVLPGDGYFIEKFSLWYRDIFDFKRSRVASKAQYNWLTERQLMLMEDSFCSQILLNSGHWVFEEFHRGKKVLIISCTWLRWILVEWRLVSLPKSP